MGLFDTVYGAGSLDAVAEQGLQAVPKTAVKTGGGMAIDPFTGIMAGAGFLGNVAVGGDIP